jgi:hypothetical protein
MKRSDETDSRTCENNVETTVGVTARLTEVVFNPGMAKVMLFLPLGQGMRVGEACEEAT